MPQTILNNSLAGDKWKERLPIYSQISGHLHFLRLNSSAIYTFRWQVPLGPWVVTMCRVLHPMVSVPSSTPLQAAAWSHPQPQPLEVFPEHRRFPKVNMGVGVTNVVLSSKLSRDSFWTITKCCTVCLSNAGTVVTPAISIEQMFEDRHYLKSISWKAAINHYPTFLKWDFFLDYLIRTWLLLHQLLIYGQDNFFSAFIISYPRGSSKLTIIKPFLSHPMAQFFMQFSLIH